MAAASWGLGDFAGGIATRLSSSLVAVFLSQGLGLLLTALLLLVVGEPLPGVESLTWGALGGVSGALGLACFYLALSRGTMGLVAPLTALLAAAWPSALALVTGGSIGQLALLGMLAALGAVVLISLPDRRLGRPALATYHGSRGQEWLLIIGASLGFGGSTGAGGGAGCGGGGPAIGVGRVTERSAMGGGGAGATVPCRGRGAQDRDLWASGRDRLGAAKP